MMELTSNTDASSNDLHYLQELLGNDKAAIQEVITEIKQQWIADKRMLSEALDRKDSAKVRAVLHRIKSSFSPLGAAHLLYKTTAAQEAAYLQKINTETERSYWQAFINNLNEGVWALKI